MQTITLHNGTEMPAMGFGTWAISDSADVAETVKMAIECGFRHIDTASFYKNETGVGQGIKNSGVDRSQLWITSKIWPTESGYNGTLQAFDASLKRLGLDYLDLYLIHWPASPSHYADWRERNADTWRALEKLYADGRVRAIGLSNFLQHHLQALLDVCSVKPMVDQLEIHPGYAQAADVEFCQKNGIAVEAWSPFGRGSSLKNADLKRIADRNHCSVAQLCLAWCRQKQIVPLPKSITPERVKENLESFSITLPAEDMTAIDRMPNIGWSGEHPDRL